MKRCLLIKSFKFMFIGLAIFCCVYDLFYPIFKNWFMVLVLIISGGMFVFYLLKFIYALVVAVCKLLVVIFKLLTGKYLVYNSNSYMVSYLGVEKVRDIFNNEILSGKDGLSYLNYIFGILVYCFKNNYYINSRGSMLYAISKEIYRRINGRYLIIKILKKIPILNFILYLYVYIFDNVYRKAVIYFIEKRYDKLSEMYDNFINSVRFRRKVFMNVVWFSYGGFLIILLALIRSGKVSMDYRDIMLDIMKGSSGYEFIGRFRVISLDFGAIFDDLVDIVYVY